MEQTKRNRLERMDNVLEKIHSQFIRLPEEEMTRNTAILNLVLKQVAKTLSDKSELFKNLYRNNSYVGSYYDGLKVGHPDEYDIDFILNLPTNIKKYLIPTGHPAYMMIKLDLDTFRKSDQVNRYPDIEKKLMTSTLSGTYLDNKKVRNWMEGLLSQPYTFSFQQEEDRKWKTFTASIRKSGPAFKLTVKSSSDFFDVKYEYFSVDLVPCFVLKQETWPDHNTCGTYPKRNFQGDILFVPKPVEEGGVIGELFWRQSLPSQEKQLIKGKYRLKQVVRLLKKLRDTCIHKKIASYYIKTIALWEQEERDQSFWYESLSYVFMEMLKKYVKYLENGSIPYYWNKDYNLIIDVKSVTITDFKNCLINILTRINLCYEDNRYYNLNKLEEVLVTSLLTPSEKQKYDRSKLVSITTNHMDRLSLSPISSSAGGSNVGASHNFEEPEQNQSNNWFGKTLLGLGVGLASAAVAYGIYRAAQNDDSDDDDE